MKEEIFPKDSAEMDMQTLETKAQNRKFQKFQYAFVYKEANSTIWDFIKFHMTKNSMMPHFFDCNNKSQQSWIQMEMSSYVC